MVHFIKADKEAVSLNRWYTDLDSGLVCYDDGIAQIAGPQVIDYTASKCLATTLITDAFLRRLID